MNKRVRYSVSFILYVFLFAFIVLSNINDWDFFFTTVEYDLQSWLMYGEVPVWSNLFCAGSTRIGDPQSFALSPIFLLFVFFGSYWGLKVFVFLSLVVGQVYLYRFLNFITSKKDSDFNFILSLCFIFSNFFISRIYSGHVTFFLIPLSIPAIFYCYKGMFVKLDRQEILLTLIVLFSVLSAGLYHLSVFFLLPLLFVFILLYLRKLYKGVGISLFDTLKLHFFVVVIPIVLSSYKLLGIWKHQKMMPRTVTDSENEFLFFGDLVQALSSPVFRGHYLFSYRGNKSWGVWEYTNFSLVFYICIFLLLYQAWRNKKIILELGEHVFLGFVIIGVGTIFFLGSFADWSPFHILNNSLLDGSVRVVGRYGVVVVLGLTILTSLLVKGIRIRHKNIFAGLIYISLVINLGASFNVGKISLVEDLGKSSDVVDSIDGHSVAIRRVMDRSFMYPLAKKGLAVPNCYNPLGRKVGFMSEFGFHKNWVMRKIPLIRGEAIPSKCRENSFISPNHIVLDSSCPEDICLNHNQLSPFEKESIEFKESEGMLCKIK